MSLNPLDYTSDEEYSKALRAMDGNEITPLNLKQTKILQKGACCDCGGTLLAGPEGPGCQNVRCKDCNMKYNVPTVSGVPGERLGLWKPDPEPVPVQLPNGNGSLVQGRGRTNVTAFALHDCSTNGDPEGWRGCVDLVRVGKDNPATILHCRSCGMRMAICRGAETWDELVEWLTRKQKHAQA